MVSLKNRDYNEQRKAIREYDGVLKDEVKRIQDSKILRLNNFIERIGVMKKIFSEKEIEGYIEKSVKDGYIAFEVIRNPENEVIGLNELEVTSIYPIINNENEDGWIQIIGDSEKEFNKDSILYISMYETFEKVVNLLD